MKSYNFNICKYHITITIKRKTFKAVEEKPQEEIKMEDKEYHVPHFVYPDQYVSTVNEPDIPTAVIAGEEVVGPVTPCFYNACVEYIESQKGKLSNATLRGYQNIANNHLDLLMECYLYDVTEELIQKSFDEEIAKGLSEKTIKGYRSFVTKVLTDYRPDLVLEIRVKPEEK